MHLTTVRKLGQGKIVFQWQPIRSEWLSERKNIYAAAKCSQAFMRRVRSRRLHAAQLLPFLVDSYVKRLRLRTAITQSDSNTYNKTRPSATENSNVHTPKQGRRCSGSKVTLRRWLLLSAAVSFSQIGVAIAMQNMHCFARRHVLIRICNGTALYLANEVIPCSRIL